MTSPTTAMPTEVSSVDDSDVNVESRSAQRLRAMRASFLSLLDQAFVSGARFATSILIGRFAGQSELGAYAMGFSLLVLVSCVLEALVAAPYVVLHAQRDNQGRIRSFNGNVLIHCALLSILSVGGFLTAAYFAPAGASLVFVALAISSPPALLREFARRMEFAHLRQHVACIIDGVVATAQVTGLFVLGSMGQLTSATAFLIIGIASAIASVSWLIILQKNFRPEPSRLSDDTRAAWRLGKWAFFAQITGLLHLQGMNWLIGGWLGLEATGLFAACSTLVLFINPFALGLNNYVAPLAVRTAHETGVAGVKRLIGRAMAFMCLSVFFFCTLIYLLSDKLMLFLFDDPTYLGHHHLIMLLGINITLNAVHMVNDGGVWALERPRVIFVSAVIAVVTTFALSVFLVPAFGLMGAASSLLIGRILAASTEAWVFFFHINDADFTSNDQEG